MVFYEPVRYGDAGGLAVHKWKVVLFNAAQ